MMKRGAALQSMHAIIIGAGVLGLWSAQALHDLGVGRITVIDKAIPGAGASGRSGALIRSGYDNPTEIALAEISREIYRNLPQADYRETGLLTLFSDHSGAARLSADMAVARANAHQISHAEAAHFAPRILLDNVHSILLQPKAGYCDAGGTIAALYAHLCAQWVDIRLGQKVSELHRKQGRVTGVVTETGLLEGDAVILAAGAWANTLLPKDAVPGLVPYLTRIAVFRPFEMTNAPFAPVIDRVQDAWFRPMPGGAVLVGSESGVLADTDPEQIPLTAPEDLVQKYRDVLARRFDVSSLAAPRGAWAGAFMVSPDARPVVGPVPNHPGLFIAGGDSGGAFKTAPGIGIALADIVTNSPGRRIDIDALSPARFDQQLTVRVAQLAGTVSR